MYGFEIPMKYKDATRLHKLHGNDKKWKTATKLEMDQLHDYDTFHDKGVVTPGEEFKKIRVHLVFAVKSTMDVINQDSMQMGI
jgi:hypothetical protein